MTNQNSATNKSPQILREVVLWCNGGHRQDAIWAAAYTSTDFLCVWGARGTKYNDRGTKYGLASGSARLEFESKLQDKLAKSYQIVSFNHTDYGNVPSFSSLLGATSGVAADSMVVTFTGEIKRFREELELESLQAASSTKLQIREIQLRQVASLLGLELVGTATSTGRLNLAALESRATSLANLAQSQPQTLTPPDPSRPRLIDF